MIRLNSYIKVMLKRRRIPDLVLFICVILLLSIGISMVYSASIHKSKLIFRNSYHFLIRQVIWAFVGIFLLFIAFNIDYHIYRKYSVVFVIFSFIFLLAVFVPGLSRKVSGPRRWLDFKFFMLNPTEIAKFSVVVYISSVFSKKKSLEFSRRYLPALIVLMVFAGLVIIQPDFGSGVFIILVGMIVFFIDGIKLKSLLSASIVLIPVLTFMIFKVRYRLRRILAFMNPASDPQDKGYHILQSLKSFNMGGISGLGFGQSRQKIWSLPAPHTDFIFSVYGEETGFIGILLLLVLFLMFLWRGVKIALNAVDDFGFLLGIGFVFMIIFQVIINMFVTIGFLPVTGISLPFISYGGSSLIMNLFIVGILLNISKTSMSEKIAESRNSYSTAGVF